MKSTKKLTPYQEKLLDPRWQKKRLEILQRDDWTCQICGDKESTLSVHHKVYWPESDPWEASPSYLITLCESCHKQETNLLYETRLTMNFATERLFCAKERDIIMKGFRDLFIRENSTHTAKIIRFALSTPDVMEKIEVLYEKSGGY